MYCSTAIALTVQQEAIMLLAVCPSLMYSHIFDKPFNMLCVIPGRALFYQVAVFAG